jgi:hypothetical protein
MTIPPHRIDVHHHLIPPDFVEAMKKTGKAEVAEAACPHWTPENSTVNMDTHGIATTIMSLSAPGRPHEAVSRFLSSEFATPYLSCCACARTSPAPSRYRQIASAIYDRRT